MFSINGVKRDLVSGLYCAGTVPDKSVKIGVEKML